MRHLLRWSLVLSLVLMFHELLVVNLVEIAQRAPDAAELATLVRGLDAVVGAPSMLAIVLFSRIDESRAMENASRQRLREAIRSEPGLGLSELSQRAQLGWGTTVYHLNRMERAGVVNSSDVGRRRAFFLTEHDRRVRDLTALLSNGAQLRLLQALRVQPNASQQELARAAQLGLPLANRYLQRLEEAGLVTSSKEWRVRRYAPTQRLLDQWGELAQREMSTTPRSRLPVSPVLSPRGTNAP